MGHVQEPGGVHLHCGTHTYNLIDRGDGFRGVSYRDGVLIKDNVVGEANIVGPGHGLASLNGDSGRVEDEGAAISSKLHAGCV